MEAQTATVSWPDGKEAYTKNWLPFVTGQLRHLYMLMQKSDLVTPNMLTLLSNQIQRCETMLRSLTEPAAESQPAPVPVTPDPQKSAVPADASIRTDDGMLLPPKAVPADAERANVCREWLETGRNCKEFDNAVRINEERAHREARLSAIVQEMRASVTDNAGQHPCDEFKASPFGCHHCDWSERQHRIWKWAALLVDEDVT